MERLTFKMDTNDFNLSSWQDVADEIEKECITSGGDVIVFGYDYKGGDTIVEYGLLLRPKRDNKELVSNCCGAEVDSLNAENIGICSECGEGCGAVEVYTEDLNNSLLEDLKEERGDNE
jgi:hypothetical protein